MEFAEVWKTIPNSKYQVSNKGRVCSPRKMLKPYYDRYGYLKVCIFKDNGRRQVESVHRLVALSFVLNPFKKPVVNHLDEIKDNNYYNNLEWCTVGENNIYGKERKKTEQPVLNMTTGKVYSSIKKASIDCNIKVPSNICRVCRGTGTCGGYMWRYYDLDI